MAAKIEIEASSGELIAATRELIEERLDSFAEANRRTKEVRAVLDSSDPAKPSVEVTALIGTKQLVGKASATNTLQAVEGAIGQIQSQLAEQRESTGSDRPVSDRAGGEDSTKTIVGGIAGVLVASVFAFTMVRTVSCTYNPANYPETAPVTGTVTLDGAPLEGAKVIFSPTDGRSSNGTTDVAGKYTLKYTGDIAGAMLGAHRVSILKEIPDPNFVPPPPVELKEGELDPGPEEAPLINAVPPRYRGRDSELSAEVKDTENVFDFALTSE